MDSAIGTPGHFQLSRHSHPGSVEFSAVNIWEGVTTIAREFQGTRRWLLALGSDGEKLRPI